MNQLIANTTLEIEEFDGVKLGMLSTNDTPFNASLILTNRFRELVIPTHGWPVFVVAPTRDFVYVISRADSDFLGRLGAVVLQEYNNSGHPVTADADSHKLLDEVRSRLAMLSNREKIPNNKPLDTKPSIGRFDLR
jgi:hypothetical protein